MSTCPLPVIVIRCEPGKLVCARCLGTGEITYGNGTSEPCGCTKGEMTFAIDPSKIPE